MHKSVHADVDPSIVAHVLHVLLELMQVYAPQSYTSAGVQHAILQHGHGHAC